ncbi:MAG: cyclic pyranopterin monophosphate synthase MoaC [Dehalococcoidia bacterium]|nr:cyclic pyranopterin monophosphate synthase MoaC [Dehalococcoidia bacterium]
MEPVNIRMIDVTGKTDTERQAVAKGRVHMKASTLELIRTGQLEKGDVLAVARTAGIMAAKQTHNLIPLCHPLHLTSVAVELSLPGPDLPSSPAECAVEITATAKGIGKTGFEMEALVAVTITALTIYDMCKAVDTDMTISQIRLMSKSGGKSGVYVAPE